MTEKDLAKQRCSLLFAKRINGGSAPGVFEKPYHGHFDCDGVVAQAALPDNDGRAAIDAAFQNLWRLFEREWSDFERNRRALQACS